MYRFLLFVCTLLVGATAGPAAPQPSPAVALSMVHPALSALPELPTAVPMDALPGAPNDDSSINRLMDIPARPPRLLSDTMEYCKDLLANLARLRADQDKLLPEVDTLANEGQRMCDQGNYRAGTNRLRNALIIVQREQNAAPAKSE